MSDRKTAQAAGYYIKRGEFTGQSENRLDRFYIGREGEGFRPFGPGYKLAREAWARAAELASEAP